MNKGAAYALAAAFLNATVGVLSLASFAHGALTSHVAFYKCLAALMVLTCMVFVNPSYRRDIKLLAQYYQELAILAFFGFFVLYFFETQSYEYHSVAIVVFALLASSTLTTFFLSYGLGLTAIGWTKFMSVLFALLGLLSFATQFPLTIDNGLLFASLAGSGYGAFLVLNKQFKLPLTGIPLLWWLSLFGTIYLVFPFLLNQPQWPNFSSLPIIFILGVAPTIGGFYCTTKALFYANALDVQLFELAEPIIATGLAFLFFQQASFSMNDLCGALCILASIALNFYRGKVQTIVV